MILTMIYQQFYIIRKGDFATDANKKIYYSLFTICLSLEEYINTGSTDCFRIMIGSTMIWTLIETILYITNTRVIKPMYITGPLKNKFLVPSDLTIGQFVYVIRKRIQLGPEQALFIYVNNSILPQSSALLTTIYNEFQDEDGFLYITYSGENTFG